jgi:hypothetical protein
VTQLIVVGTPPAPVTPINLVVASAGGPYAIVEGQSLTLDASGSVGHADRPLSYTWDVNGDGVFGDAVGVSPVLTWAQLMALGITDGPNTRAVAVRIGDGSFTLDAPATLDVRNAPPTAGLAGPASGIRGQALSFTLTATDPSPADQAAGFTFRIDWDGDGTVDQTVTGPSGTAVAHTYAAAGSYSVRVTAEDKDHGVSPGVTLPVNIISRVASAVTVASSINPAILGQSVTFTATVATVAGSAAPTGSIQFQVDGVNFGTPQLLAAGVARLTAAALPVGNHVVTAVYNGDASYLPGSGQVTQAVRYQFSGFRPPLQAGGSYNLGRDVQIKFQLTDFAGNAVTALSAVRSLRNQRLDDAGNPLGAPFSPASSNGQGLQVSGGQFVFNWKTTGLTAGRYRIVLELDDGTTWTLDLRLV